DPGADDRLAARVAVDLLDHVVGLDERTVAVVIHGMAALERGELRRPGAEVAPEATGTAVGGEGLERRRHEPDVAPVHALDLVDLGTVDVQVRDAPRVAGEL